MNLNTGDTRLIIDECKKYGCLRNQAAYLLATAYLETAYTMKPIAEYGGNSYFHRMYDIEGRRPKKARELGNIHPGDGVKFKGRGYVMITGRSNYKRAGAKIGVGLEKFPDRAMEPEIAAKFLVAGTMEGWWTGLALPKYITLKKSDFFGARRTVNGLDKASQIAQYAVAYDKALEAEGYGVRDMNPIPQPQAKPRVHKPLTESKEIIGGITGLIAALSALLESVDGSTVAIIMAALAVGFIGNRLYARWKDQR